MLARIRFNTLALIALCAAPTAVLAAEPEHEAVGAIPTIQQGMWTAVTALVVFAIVFAVLAVKVWPVITRALDERADKIKSEIEAAEMARRQAKEALANYEKSLAEARTEAQRMLEQARAQQQSQAAEIRAKADADMLAMKEKVMRDIDAAKKQALADIYAEAGNLATMVAGKILKREITQSDQNRLVQDALVEMKASPTRA